MQHSRAPGVNCASPFSAALMLSLALWALSCDARPLRLEDYLDLQQVTAPQISPDGKTIVYVRARVNVREDRFDSDLWVMDADGSHNRRLMEGGSEARWSPDSSRIAFTKNAGKGNEVFVRWADAQGSTSQITYQGMNPESLSWSPNGRWIAFMARVPVKPKWDITLPEKPAGAHWTADAVVIDQLHYRMDRVGQTAGKYWHIFIVSAEGGTPKQLTRGEWHAEPSRSGMPSDRGTLEWTPDSKSIIFSADREVDSDTNFARANLHAVDVSTGNLRSITHGAGFWGLSPGPRLSPDGKLLAYIGARASNTSNYPSLELHVIGSDGKGERTLLADLPNQFTYLQWDKDGRTLYYGVGKEGAYHVYSVSLAGAVKSITSGARSIELSSVSRNGIAAGLLTTSATPPEVVQFSLRNAQDLRVLTAVNEAVLSDVQLGRVEEIWFDSPDRTKVQGWIVYPPNFDASKKYPLILDIHGGPEYMYDSKFSFAFQDMAAQGYAVLYTNPRGSTGYGGAFARAVYDAYPGRADYEDLMSGVDTVIGRGFVDPERMYVQGCSGGGVLTTWIVTKTDRFAAAAPQCTAVNMISLAGSNDIPGWVFNRFKKPFWEDPTAWLATSSIMQIDKVKTPTLVMVGEKDTRTPVAQSEELYTALKVVNVPTKLILFKDEWHGTRRKPSNMLRTQLYLRKWYGEWRRVMEDGKAVWKSGA